MLTSYIYLIIKILKTFPVLLITGPRQVGKTTLLQKIAEENRKYVTLDDPDARLLAKTDPALDDIILFYTTKGIAYHLAIPYLKF